MTMAMIFVDVDAEETGGKTHPEDVDSVVVRAEVFTEGHQELAHLTGSSIA